MPSPTTVTTSSKGRPFPRQHSLQCSNQPSNKFPAGRSLRRQHSEDERSLTEEVRITGMGWTQPGTDLKIASRAVQEKGERKIAPRPKPARLAWGERRSESVESVPGEGVEIVAKRYEGQPRPNVRMPRAPSVPLASASPLVLSRQQLAKRLRRAWRSREQQHNLDIFLAHGRSDTDQSDTPKSGRKPIRASHSHSSNLSIFLASDTGEDDALSVADTVSQLGISTRIIPKSNGSTKNLDIFLASDVGEDDPLSAEETARTKPAEPATLFERNRIDVKSSSATVVDTKSPALANLLDFKMFPVAEATKKFGTDYSSRQFKMASLSLAKTISFDDGDKENVPESAVGEKPQMSASARRASFRSSQLFSKAVTESGSDEEDAVPVSARPPLLRASSAPTPRPASPATVRKKSPKGQKSSLRLLSSPGGSVKTLNSDVDINKNLLKTEKRAKPSGGARRKAKDRKQQAPEGDTSDEEPVESKSKAPRRRPMRPCGEVITMVSLVSPAESDAEDPPPPLPPWAEERGKSAKNGGEEIRGVTAKIAPSSALVFSLAAKKTVSFQPHPPMNRSYSASFPLRRAPPGAPIIVPTLQQPPVQRQDNRGVKRRLVRSCTVPAKDDGDNNSSDDTSKTDTSSTEPVTEVSRNSGEAGNEKDREEDEEPDLKTAKEKECWLLYKRMLDKGVSVSYDTVLRGMMTPTEYRLRKSRQMSRS